MCGVGGRKKNIAAMTRDPVLVQTERGSPIVQGIPNVFSRFLINRSYRQDTGLLKRQWMYKLDKQSGS